MIIQWSSKKGSNLFVAWSISVALIEERAKAGRSTVTMACCTVRFPHL